MTSSSHRRKRRWRLGGGVKKREIVQDQKESGFNLGRKKETRQDQT